MAYGYVFSVNQLHSAYFALLSHLQPCVLATHKHIFSRVNFSLPTMCTAHYPFFFPSKGLSFCSNWLLNWSQQSTRATVQQMLALVFSFISNCIFTLLQCMCSCHTILLGFTLWHAIPNGIYVLVISVQECVGVVLTWTTRDLNNHSCQ